MMTNTTLENDASPYGSVTAHNNLVENEIKHQIDQKRLKK